MNKAARHESRPMLACWSQGRHRERCFADGAATAPVPDWTVAMPTLPGPWRESVEREHATLELADAASVRPLAVLGSCGATKRITPWKTMR